MLKRIIYIVLSVTLLSSCVTTRRVNYLQDKAGKLPDSSLIDTIPVYTLKAGDMVAVRISTLDEESKRLFSGGIVSDMMTFNTTSDLYTYTVYGDGTIYFPFIGNIKLLGLTTRQAKDTLRSLLQVMIPDCDVDVRLVNAYFSLLGVSGSGRYSISKENLTLFEAFALTSDLSLLSDRTKVHVLRQDAQGKTKINTFDVRNKQIMYSEFFYIQPNDIVYVQAYNGQFFGIDSFPSGVSFFSSLFSFGYLMYYYITPLF